ncbi:MAG: ABC transporter ATP-binding protein [bacterium]|nr:ABC transporter ATP-binding protein [bacterium]
MASIIRAENLRKVFGPITAVEDISLDVDIGEVLGFLGPNGAGKTTTMRMLTGYLRPTRGSVSICGIDMLSSPVQAKRHIGYLPEGAPLYPEMTPADLLAFVGACRGLSGAALSDRMARVSDMVNLGEVWTQPVETLSKGYKRRLGLAQAILHDPDILILDEPTDGLDPNQKREVRDLIRTMAREKAIVVSTHILEEVNAVCSRALIIGKGRIVADGTPGELAAMSRYHNAVTIRLASGETDALALKLDSLDTVSGVEKTAGHGQGQITAFPAAGRPIIQEVADLLREKHFEVFELRQETGRLDEVFRDVTADPGGESVKGGAA